MEKYVQRTCLGRCSRFLKRRIKSTAATAAFFMLFLLSVRPAHSSDYNNLRFVLDTPPEQTQATANAFSSTGTADTLVYTDTEYSFTLIVPDTAPVNVEAVFTPPPQTAYFSGFHKTASHTGATVVNCTVRFVSAGHITLPPASIRIDGKTHTVPFPSLTVAENPVSVMPEFFFTETEAMTAGQSTGVTLMGRCFTHIESVHFELPENALLEKSAAFLPLEPQTQNIGSEAVKIAEFIYTPFFEGSRIFPRVEVSAQGYNGNIYTVQAESFIINVLPPQEQKNPAYAPELKITDNPETHGSGASDNLSLSDSPSVDTEADDTAPPAAALGDTALRIASLRAKERTSPLFTRFRSERRAVEKAAGLRNPDEVSVFWTNAGLLLSCILIPLIIVLPLPLKRGKKAAIALTISLSLSAPIIIRNLPQLTQTAVIAHKAVLRSIPETDAQGAVPLPEGVRLHILRTNGQWYLADTAVYGRGWLLKTECIPIK